MMKTVQVPMAAEEADELAALARKLRISRADLIRRACRNYIDGLRRARLEQEYERGYTETPEGGEIAVVSASLASTFLPAEDWSS